MPAAKKRRLVPSIHSAAVRERDRQNSPSQGATGAIRSRRSPRGTPSRRSKPSPRAGAAATGPPLPCWGSTASLSPGSIPSPSQRLTTLDLARELSLTLSSRQPGQESQSCGVDDSQGPSLTGRPAASGSTGLAALVPASAPAGQGGVGSLQAGCHSPASPDHRQPAELSSPPAPGSSPAQPAGSAPHSRDLGAGDPGFALTAAAPCLTIADTQPADAEFGAMYGRAATENQINPTQLVAETQAVNDWEALMQALPDQTAAQVAVNALTGSQPSQQLPAQVSSAAHAAPPSIRHHDCSNVMDHGLQLELTCSDEELPGIAVAGTHAVQLGAAASQHACQQGGGMPAQAAPPASPRALPAPQDSSRCNVTVPVGVTAQPPLSRQSQHHSSPPAVPGQRQAGRRRSLPACALPAWS